MSGTLGEASRFASGKPSPTGTLWRKSRCTEGLQRTRRPIRNWVSVTTPALPKEWGPRNTRKDAKGDKRYGLGDPYHIARPDIGRGTRSRAIRRGMSKK